MNQEDFERLKASIIEAGQIKRGLRPASREFVRRAPPLKQEPLHTLAVCVATDDAKLLIPRKIYEVRLGVNRIWVEDEEGETTICPPEWFLPLALPSETEELLAKVA